MYPSESSACLSFIAEMYLSTAKDKSCFFKLEPVLLLYTFPIAFSIAFLSWYPLDKLTLKLGINPLY